MPTKGKVKAVVKEAKAAALQAKELAAVKELVEEAAAEMATPHAETTTHQPTALTDSISKIKALPLKANSQAKEEASKEHAPAAPQMASTQSNIVKPKLKTSSPRTSRQNTKTLLKNTSPHKPHPKTHYLKTL